MLAIASVVRDTRIELASPAWEADVLPLYESRWPATYSPPVGGRTKYGVDKRIRTADLLFTCPPYLAANHGAAYRIWTDDLSLTKGLLYHWAKAAQALRKAGERAALPAELYRHYDVRVYLRRLAAELRWQPRASIANLLCWFGTSGRSLVANYKPQRFGAQGLGEIDKS